ncbi:MAG: alpha/beta fold hydrolase [Longimicrobiales bacterium]
MATAPNFAEVYAGMVEQTPTGALDPGDVARVKRSALATPAHLHLGGLDGLADPSIWNDDPISVPLLVIRADSPARAADDEDHVRRIAPHVEYHLWRDVSHFIQLEKPEAFNPLLQSFIDRVVRSSDRSFS